MCKNHNKVNPDSSFISAMECSRPQVWGIYIILKGTGIEGFIFSQLLTAEGRKHSRLSWQTVLEFVPKAIVLHVGWPGLPGKSGLCDVLLMAFGIPVMHWSGR